MERETDGGFANAVHAVEHGVHAELLGYDGALFIDHAVANETGGDDFHAGIY